MSERRSITGLTPEQQKAFNALKRAYKKCERMGILFVNQYGDITAYDSALIKRFVDKLTVEHESIPAEYTVPLYGNNNADYFRSEDSWADDEGCHYLVLTEKGRELWEERTEV